MVEPAQRCASGWCGRAFELRPLGPFFGRGRFCSSRCLFAAQRAHTRPVRSQRGSDYRRFRDAEVARVGHCELCGAREYLCLHHIIRTRDRPDLLYEQDNLQVLCSPCHARAHRLAGHMNAQENTP